MTAAALTRHPRSESRHSEIESSPQLLLVVDDDEVELELVTETLAEAFPGAKVRAAADPLAAERMCGDEHFDCVLLDYNMPQIDGLALAARLRSAEVHLPIVLMTSVGDEMLAAQALRCGASDYIPKSRINADSIRRSIDRSIHAASQARLIAEQRGELETFAFALTHDFKQPIRQISTFTQLIDEEIRGGRTDSLHRHLDFLNNAARRLGKLVDVMSQYTLLNQPPEIGEVDLGKVMKDIRASIAPYLKDRGGKLVYRGGAPLLRGNETLAGQVLQNLILNGFQYNQNPAPQVTVSARREDEHCVILIKDNGIGIDPDYLSEIFKPLVRLHTASEYPGSGLGLTLARKAVMAQGGTIWCESELGRGSTFHVCLPVARTWH